jgi:hypothetical protein
MGIGLDNMTNIVYICLACIVKFLKLIHHLIFASFVEQEMAKTVAKLSEEGKV